LRRGRAARDVASCEGAQGLRVEDGDELTPEVDESLVGELAEVLGRGLKGGAGAPSCDPGLSIALSPASQTVQNGTEAVFDETITIAPDATQGATLQCTIPFTLNGADAGAAFTQTVSIDVNDVTPPSVSCPPGPNPAGTELTQAPGAPVKAKHFTGDVTWKFTFDGDAQLIATDAAGNTATATCLVPPND
jgi:hypothetical protein